MTIILFCFVLWALMSLTMAVCKDNSHLKPLQCTTGVSTAISQRATGNILAGFPKVFMYSRKQLCSLCLYVLINVLKSIASS